MGQKSTSTLQSVIGGVYATLDHCTRPSEMPSAAERRSVRHSSHHSGCAPSVAIHSHVPGSEGSVCGEELQQCTHPCRTLTS